MLSRPCRKRRPSSRDDGGVSWVFSSCCASVGCLMKYHGDLRVVKNPPANAGDLRDVGSIPGSGRSPGEGHRNPLQYSCLGNPMDRGAWQATVHRVAKSHLELRRHSRVTTGISAFPLGWPWEAQSSPRVARESWGWRSSHWPGRPGTPSRPRRGIASPVAIRRG